jgi:hypothetical protein
MKKYLLLMALSGSLFSCKSKKPTLADDDKADVHDFIAFFQPLKLPYQVGDTVLRKPGTDSSLIPWAVFSRFVPDTVLAKYFGKTVRPRIEALGKVRGGQKETYLFVKATGLPKKMAFVLCFDKEDKFATARPLFTAGGDPHASNGASMDARWALSISRRRKAPDGQVFFHKDTYIFDGAGSFTLILTESNENTSGDRAVIDPIDSLPRKHKFSGDYVQDSRNFISVRDGKDPAHIRFFVHFEKEGGQCKGELKGRAKFIAPGIARYRSNEDPCTVEFVFSSQAVSMKELEGCGNFRDIKCFFDGRFPRRKKGRQPANKRSPGHGH